MGTDAGGMCGLVFDFGLVCVREYADICEGLIV